jgi:hypothetical protein
VLLHTGLPVDDHEEVEPDGGRRVHRPLVGAPPADNLRLQSVVLAGASAFVGTYGGFSYLAATYGVPTLALASNPERFFPAHLELARRLAAAAGGPFALLDTAALDAVSLLAAADRVVAT